VFPAKGCECGDLKTEVANLKAEINTLKVSIAQGSLKGEKGDTPDVTEVANSAAELVRQQLVVPVRTKNGTKFSPTVEYPLDGKTPVTLQLRPVSKLKGGDPKSTQQATKDVYTPVVRLRSDSRVSPTDPQVVR
jgi:hypothetical protein